MIWRFGDLAAPRRSTHLFSIVMKVFAAAEEPPPVGSNDEWSCGRSSQSWRLASRPLRSNGSRRNPQLGIIIGRQLRLARMHIVDRIFGWFLVMLGCAHNFVAAPLTYDQLSAQALWFVSAGLSLWYAGFINLLRSYSAEPTRLLRIFCILTNLSMLAFVLAHAVGRGNWAAPASLALIGTVASLTVFSVVSAAVRPRES